MAVAAIVAQWRAGAAEDAAARAAAEQLRFERAAAVVYQPPVREPRSYTAEDIDRAVEDFLQQPPSRGMVRVLARLARSIRSVGQQYGVPVTTLRRHIEARRAGRGRPVRGRRPWLTAADEALVADWLVMRASYNSAVMRLELRQRVALLAEVRGGPQFPIGKPAGRRWMRSFLRRHPHLVTTTTRTTSPRLPSRDEWSSFFGAVRVPPLSLSLPLVVSSPCSNNALFLVVASPSVLTE